MIEELKNINKSLNSINLTLYDSNKLKLKEVGEEDEDEEEESEDEEEDEEGDEEEEELDEEPSMD